MYAWWRCNQVYTQPLECLYIYTVVSFSRMCITCESYVWYYTYICICIHTNLSTHGMIVRASIYACVYAHEGKCKYIYIYTYIYTRTHGMTVCMHMLTCISTRKHVHTHNHTVCIYVCLLYNRNLITYDTHLRDLEQSLYVYMFIQMFVCVCTWLHIDKVHTFLFTYSLSLYTQLATCMSSYFANMCERLHTYECASVRTCRYM